MRYLTKQEVFRSNPGEIVPDSTAEANEITTLPGW